MAEVLSWIDPAASTTALDGSGNYTGIIGRQGLIAAPQSFIEQDIPLSPGSRLRQVKTLPSVVRVPLLVQGSTESALITNIRTLRAAMNPLRGDGTLQYQAADSTTRQLTCRLQSGFEGDESDGARGPGFIVLPLTFYAFDPYWYDASATTATYTTFGNETINNTGDVECWPTWTIHGPTTNLTINNTTTGKSMHFTLTLGGSDILVINTAPGVKTAVLNSTTNEYSTLDATSALFSFATGNNVISFTVSGTSGSTSIGLSYKRRWLGV